jgi:hypothetical protein
MSAETLTTYTIEISVPDDAGVERRTLRVRGATEPQAIMGAYDYLVRQYDGAGEVHETTLTPIDGGPVIIDGVRP